MRWRIAAVGRLRRGFARSGCEHYQDRLARWAKVEAVEVREGRGTPGAVRAQEAAALWAQADGRVVALDERGRAFRTRDLAAHVAALERSGTSRITILVGGAEGLDTDLMTEVDEHWRLSDLTLPHELARLLLLEQLYRIETLRAGHPYHRD